MAALLGTVTWPSEIRTRDGAQFLVFGTMADGDRLPDEPPTMVRVECFGDVEALAPRLVKSASVYCEGSLRLNVWIGKDGTERSGLNIKCTHLEVL